MKLSLEDLSPVLAQSPATALQLQRWQAAQSASWVKNHRPDGTHDRIQERGRTTGLGEWITLPYSSTRFSCNNGGTWTVSPTAYQHFRYTLIGKTLFFNIYIETSAITVAAPSFLSVLLPSNEVTGVPYLVGPSLAFGCLSYDDNGTLGTGMFQAGRNSLRDLAFFKDTRGTATWTVSNAMTFLAQGFFEIQ